MKNVNVKETSICEREQFCMKRKKDTQACNLSFLCLFLFVNKEARIGHFKKNLL